MSQPQTVGPNVYFGSEGEGTFAFVMLEHRPDEKFPMDQNSSCSYQH